MRRGRDIDQAIVELARPQLSVVHARQLRAAGVSRDAVRHRVQAGWMAKVVGSSYAVGPTCVHPTFEVQCMAGAVAGGPSARIDGDTAAALLEIWNRPVHAVHVAVPGRAPRHAPPFCFHQVDIDQPGLAVGPIPVARLAQLVASHARRGTPWQLAYMINRAEYRELGSLAEVAELVASRPRAPGNSVVRAAIELVDGRSSGTRSLSEDRSLGDLLAAGVPVPVVNTRGAMGMSRDEADFVWPHLRRNIEMDGGHHDEPAQAEDDALRDAEAAELGWEVLRVATRDYWKRPGPVVRQMVRFLAGDPVPLVPGSRRLAAR